MPDPDTMTLDECRAFVGQTLNIPLPPATIDAALGMLGDLEWRWMRWHMGWEARSRYGQRMLRVDNTGNHTLDAWRLAVKVVIASQT